ncbi:MAG: hypothetical protein V4504_00405 [Patescibacteria group bacterium]
METENKKTISELNNKVWYRALKFFYGLSFLVVLIHLTLYLVNLPFHWVENDIYQMFGFYDRYAYSPDFIGVVFSYVSVLVIFELIRRAFYYIVFGAIKPKK